jgi:hypothetical protein
MWKMRKNAREKFGMRPFSIFVSIFPYTYGENILEEIKRVEFFAKLLYNTFQYCSKNNESTSSLR